MPADPRTGSQVRPASAAMPQLVAMTIMSTGNQQAAGGNSQSRSSCAAAGVSTRRVRGRTRP